MGTEFSTRLKTYTPFAITCKCDSEITQPRQAHLKWRLPDGCATRLKVRSMVGLLPLCATSVFEPWQREKVPRVMAILKDRWQRMPDLRNSVHPTGPGYFGCGDRGIAALVNPERLRRILSRMLDENEFLSPYGIQALSRYHAEHPYVFNVDGQEYRVNYLPAESDKRPVRRKLQLAWSNLDARQCAAHSRFAAVLHLSRRQLQNRVSYGLGQTDEPV